MSCACRGLGLVRVLYHHAAPDDLALCCCDAGQRYRAIEAHWPGWILAAWRLPPEMRVAWLEDFWDAPVAALALDNGGFVRGAVQQTDPQRYRRTEAIRAQQRKRP